MKRSNGLEAGLIKAECDFSQLDETELEVCRDYELAREIALRDRVAPKDRFMNVVVYPLLENPVLAIRQNWKVSKQETEYSNESPNWLQIPASRVVVLYDEWPNLPYLQIPKRERRRRIRTLFPESDKAEDLDRKVTRIQRELRELRDSGDVGGIRRRADLQEQLASIAAFIQPNWRGSKRIFQIAIPTNEVMVGQSLEGAEPAERIPPVYRRDVEAAFRALLMIEFPELPDHKDLGRSNGVVLDDLNSLAVQRLTRAGLKRSEIVDIVRVPGSPGSRSYSSPKKLDYPKRRLFSRMWEFYLQILNALEPSQPYDPQ